MILTKEIYLPVTRGLLNGISVHFILHVFFTFTLNYIQMNTWPKYIVTASKQADCNTSLSCFVYKLITGSNKNTLLNRPKRHSVNIYLEIFSQIVRSS